MKSIKAFTERYPLLFSVLVLALTIAATEIPLAPLLEKLFSKQAAFYLAETFEQSVCALLVGIYIAQEGILRKAGLLKIKRAKELWLVWPILVFSVLNGWSLFDGTLVPDFSKPGILVLFLLIALSTGFYEEIVCRGLILSVCLKKWGRTRGGIYRAVLISSVIFGLFHFTNYIMGRGSLLEVSTQIIYAVFFGVFFAACFLRFGSIWPAIITHALFDMMGTANDISVGYVFTKHMMDTNYSLETALVTLIILLPLFIWGLIILRKAPIADTRQAETAD